jgi:HAE1 family hydrophobic/amphiphilic exporter-1
MAAVGRLLHEFAVTISVAILVSGFVSISLTPMLCSRFLTPPHSQRHGRFYNATERVFDAWRGLYDRTLRLSLRFHALTMAVSLALLVATGYLFRQIPKGFLPSEDQGRFNVTTEAVQGIGFDDMVRHQIQVADIISRIPTSGLTNNVGQGGGLNTGRMDVDLKPRAERTQTVDQIIAALRPQLAQVPGIRAYLVNRPPINLGGQGGARSLYQFTLQDTDTGELYHWAPIFEDKVRLLPGLEDVSSDLQVKNPQIRLDGSSKIRHRLMNRSDRAYTRMDSPGVPNHAPNQYQVVMQVAPGKRSGGAVDVASDRPTAG